MLATPPRQAWWRRLHAGLMPDYNRKAAVYWWLAVISGAAVLVYSVGVVARLPPMAWTQIIAGMLLAMLSGMFPVRIPGTKVSFVAGEIFIFLLLLVQGPAAAAVAAAGEAAMGSYRSSKRWTSRIASPAIAALAMFCTGSLLHAVLARLDAAGWSGPAPLLGAAMVFAVLYFLVGALLMGGSVRLKRNEAFFQLLDLISVFRWVGMAYAGSASIAALLYITYRQSGAGVMMVMLPLLAMLLVTLHFYFRQQETTEAMRQAGAESAEREAALMARETHTAQRHLAELLASERRFHAAFTHASIGMALMQFDGRILQANPALASLLGYEETALAEHRLQDFVLAEDLNPLQQQLGLLGAREFEGFARELQCRHQNGSTVWVTLHCSFFTEPGAASPCLILQAQDVTARHQAEAGLQHLAFHDSLTGLPNRRRFLECLSGAVARSQADPNYSFSVMFLDFDRFKLVNDSLGHSAGDDLLAQLARRIQENLRPSDIAARLGGDEFAILAEHLGQERGAIQLAERLMLALQRPFNIGGVEIVSSASIGITFSAFGYQSGEEVLRDADTAMYKAKLQGKAGYALFDASLHTAVSDRLRLEGDLRHAIEQGQLSIAYQPQFELASGRVCGFEALVRWNHPQDGSLGPASFLHIAEETGLMLQVSDFVVHCACQQLRQWQLSHPSLAELTMSVNISANDLANRAFVARIGRAIVEAGLRPQHLTLELTESILMSHIEGALTTLAELRSLGTRLAVDDFGTGYSSLSHLAKLPIDSLKIDRSFVSQLNRPSPGMPDSAESTVVQAIIQLGGSLRKVVVAEGIESAQQMEQLRAMGCEFGQGFHLATPLTAQAASALLQSGRSVLH